MKADAFWPPRPCGRGASCSFAPRGAQHAAHVVARRSSYGQVAVRPEQVEPGEIVLYMRHESIFHSPDRKPGPHAGRTVYGYPRGLHVRERSSGKKKIRSAGQGHGSTALRLSVRSSAQAFSVSPGHLAWLFCHWGLLRRIGLRLCSYRRSRDDGPGRSYIGERSIRPNRGMGDSKPAPRSCPKVNSSYQITVEIGGMPILLHTPDDSFRQLLARRYAGFVGSSASPVFEFDIE